MKVDSEPFEGKIMRLTVQSNKQFAQSARLGKTIRGNLERLGDGA